MRLEDGTVHTFGHKGQRGIAIGWLDFEDETYEYPYQGEGDMETRRALIAALHSIPRQSVLRQRGPHHCNLGESCTEFGGAEYVIEHAGKTYIAPALILHYVQKHWYMPPADFVAAVLAQGAQGAQ